MLNFKRMSFVNTSLSVKYNKILKALLLGLYESSYTALGESRDKYSPRFRLVLYLPLDSHLELYISYKLAAVL